MSKRGVDDREGYAPSQGNMRKARVEVARRVDAFQMLMASARAKAAQEAKQQAQQQQGPQADAAAQQPASAAGGQHALAAGRPGTGLAAPCTHCGTVLVAESGALRQCCACLDVYCSCCSVIDYEEREDRVFCLGCLEEQSTSGRQAHGGGGQLGSGMGGPGGHQRHHGASGGLGYGMGMQGASGRWGALDGGAAPLSPFPCAGSRTPGGLRTPQGLGQQGSHTPVSVLHSARSHRGFSALLAL